MDVFIGNLPADGHLVELKEILKGRKLHSRFELRSGKDCFDKHYHYFVVYTETDDQGWELIEELNGKIFSGNRLTVREYMRRSTSNKPSSDWDGRERRINLT